MRTLAVVPIKTLSAAKQRLAGALATGARQSLAQAMFSDVLAALRRSQQVEAIAVDAAELDDLLVRCEADGVGMAVVPDRHGTGTNALVLTPPAALEPSFGPGSFGRHMNHAVGAGLNHRAEHVASLAHDVDTPEDLAALAEALEGRRTIAPRTRGALRQLERS